MSSLYKQMAADTLLDTHGNYLIHQLSREEITAAVLRGWQPDMSKLSGANDSWEEAVAEQLRLRSQRDWEQSKMRGSFRMFSNRILESRRGRRGTTTYELYFPNGLAPLGRAKLDKQIATGRAILLTLQSETDASIQAAGETLRESVAAAEIVEKAWQEINATVKERKVALDAAKVAWLSAYRRVDGELRALYAGDREMVSTFFYRRPQRKSAAESQEEGGEDAGATNGAGGAGAVNGAAGAGGANSANAAGTDGASGTVGTGGSVGVNGTNGANAVAGPDATNDGGDTNGASGANGSAGSTDAQNAGVASGSTRR